MIARDLPTLLTRTLFFLVLTAASVAGNEKVRVEMYYMPQCPGCRQYISTSFSDAFHTEGFHDMAEVSFIPWGRNHHKESAELHKAHHDRVFDNVLESCALDTIGKENPQDQFAYIECIDHTKAWEVDPATVDRSCARVIGLSPEQTRRIEECAVSKEGHDLAEANFQRAESIGMEFAPWIVVNGARSEEIDTAVWNSLFDFVCSIYTGPRRSQFCKNEIDDMMTEQL